MGTDPLIWLELQRRRTDKLGRLGLWTLPPCRAATGQDGTQLVTLGDAFRVSWLAGQTRGDPVHAEYHGEYQLHRGGGPVAPAEYSR